MLPTCQEGIPKSVLCLGPNPASLAARVQTRKRKYHNRTIHGAMREAEAYLTKRCQSCGTMSNLEVHHREFRQPFGSRLGGQLDHAVHDMPLQSASPLGWGAVFSHRSRYSLSVSRTPSLPRPKSRSRNLYSRCDAGSAGVDLRTTRGTGHPIAFSTASLITNKIEAYEGC
jgi:hypothetical protein